MRLYINYILNMHHQPIWFYFVDLRVGSVVTGVRFALFNGHLRLEVRATQFDWFVDNINFYMKCRKPK